MNLMGDRLENFKLKQNSARKYYENWRKEKTYSKALSSEIKITRSGWDHISKGSKTKRRRIQDKINRYNLLKCAKFVIKNAKTFSTETRREVKYFILRENCKVNGKVRSVKVLIKKDLKGNYIFYSVMKK
ncbi:hypothetical protein KC669_03810 [Candidatus Dojkabacteria bacterium]|uniref:Large polyvalent protein-associated domain-containing protein n=1 Tax=Candidatus Dojkabacteria bacterium TaxID=2099670 RepID=A0A955RM98_9BACT|nr:hypothetical protein [Candidatus Dojkabacteria bacterium]